MKKFRNHVISMLLIGGSLPSAVAQESNASPASLSLQFSGLEWSQSKSKLSNEDKAHESTSLVTSDLADAFIWISIDKLNVYFYPFQDDNSLLSLSYMVRDDLELGLDLGLNATRVKEPKHEISSDLIGAFATWSVPVGNFSLENIAVLDFTRAESTVFNSTSNEEETSKVTGTYMRLSSTALLPLGKNAFYMAGVWVAAENSKNHTNDSSSKASQWGLMLAGLRITMN